MRFGDNAVSERVPTPPSTRMIQVNLDSGATRVVRRIAPCDDVIDDAKTHSGEILRCRGLLLKKGGGTSLFGRRKWQDRFVDLDPVMGTITYYSDRERRHRKGSLKVGAAGGLGRRLETLQGRAKDIEDPATVIRSRRRGGKPREGALSCGPRSGQLQMETNRRMGRATARRAQHACRRSTATRRRCRNGSRSACHLTQRLRRCRREHQYTHPLDPSRPRNPFKTRRFSMMRCSRRRGSCSPRRRLPLLRRRRSRR